MSRPVTQVKFTLDSAIVSAFKIRMLEEIAENEGAYRDNIPAQFEQRYETSDQTTDMLSEAIACLQDAY